MSESSKVVCPDCGGEIIDTTKVVQPYHDLDNYDGIRCDRCGRTFADSEIEAMCQRSSD